MGTLLKVQDLTVRFDTLEGVVHAVNGISYTLDEGEALGIVGESGCGKSVGVLSVMGLIPQPPGRITDGRVLYQGEDLFELSEAELEDMRGKDIAMIFQDPMTSFNPVLTVGHQISEPLIAHTEMKWEKNRQRVKGILEGAVGRRMVEFLERRRIRLPEWTRKPIEHRHRVVQLLDLVGIPSAASRYGNYPHQFSGGMRQRGMISMGLACNPKVLIADEPTTALDVTIQAQIVDLVKDLRDRLGMAIIWITHDLGVVAGLVEKMVVMYAGFIVEKGSVDHIYGDTQHPYTLALLSSLPRVDRSSDDRLSTIPGLPPDLLGLPPGCPFKPRCPYVIERCRERNPPLQTVSPGHEVACWVDVTTRRPR
jgi:oligopeptide transport system ATP-binding protein